MPSTINTNRVGTPMRPEILLLKIHMKITMDAINSDSVSVIISAPVSLFLLFYNNMPEKSQLSVFRKC